MQNTCFSFDISEIRKLYKNEPFNPTSWLYNDSHVALFCSSALIFYWSKE